MSIVDIAVASAIINARYTGFDVDKNHWPKLASHLSSIKAHPVVATCMETELPMIAAHNNARNERLKKVS